MANLSGVTLSTVYSMVDPRRREISITAIKKLCDGLEITLGEFFSSPEFDTLEQEIKYAGDSTHCLRFSYVLTPAADPAWR